MKSAFALAAVALASSVLAQLTVSSPAQLVTCQPAALSWTGGVAPYYLSVIPGGSPGSAALENFPTQQGTSYTWPEVNIAAGTSITIQIRDSTGAVQYSSPVTIQPGSDSSCVGQSLSAGSSSTMSSAGAAGSSSVGVATTPAASTVPAAPTSVSVSSSMSVSSSAAASSSTAAVSSTAVSVSKASTVAAATSSAASLGASATSAAAAASSTAAKSGAASDFKSGAFSIAALAGLLGAALF